ncbi:DUF4432 family protein [Lichenihabitans sp. Uapishka_5]|uniref:DUF4432 family protein n=1 Tax=Lichenihabitans sp. Uapishka_5 TaxID=3037302 RepID=UPI0029E7FD5E|nr:DUF4432 family protein [Lichenihabitans sp. Uapishka_5]MDX7951044.1 DUF4432 family protein [Lichenihabitans sp. Uapishka_5]
MITTIALDRTAFAPQERLLLRHGALSATLFRYDTGVEAIRIANGRGSVTVLPFMGQMVWRASFDGVELAMDSMFDRPRPATTILETYGCLAYHAGLLRNGVPGEGDTHPLHGEFPCLPMDSAGLECGQDEGGAWLAVTGMRDYAMEFGAHYRATPRVVLREGATCFTMVMEAENRSAAPMDLMYICHANFAFVPGGRIVQPVPFDSAHVVIRTAIPSHVRPTADYRALLDELAVDPGRMERLDAPERYDPEQVCYIKGLTPGSDGRVHVLLRRPEGDGFTVAYDPIALPHTIRWVLNNSDQRTAAFAMPGTCEPEGYTAERRKGHLRELAGGARVVFATELGYADQAGAATLAQRISGNES